MESLNEALATLINQATTGIDASMGFLQAEIPDVIVQLLMWHGVKSALMASVAALLFPAVILLARFVAYPICLTEYANKDKAKGEAMAIGFVGSIIALIPFFVLWNLTWLQIWIAPKVWLLEYAASLVK